MFRDAFCILFGVFRPLFLSLFCLYFFLFRRFLWKGTGLVVLLLYLCYTETSQLHSAYSDS